MHHLVTGGAGFIGSHLVDALAARGDEVTVLDDLSTGRTENLESAMGTGASLKLVEGSVLDETLVAECMARADTCFHLAAAVGVKLILERPRESMLNNVRGTELVVEAAARHGCRLLFTSSSEIYGKDSGGPLAESSDRILGSPSTLRWSYATSKAFGEALLNAHLREGDCDLNIVRLFNTVGPRQTGAYGMVLPRFVRQALEGEPLTVFGDGTQTRCFVHVADTVAALLLLMDSEQTSGGTFNVGAVAEISISELARTVIERAGSSSTIELVPYERAYGEDFEELGRRIPDLSAIRAAVGWEPTRSLAEVIDDAVALGRDGVGTFADASVRLD